MILFVCGPNFIFQKKTQNVKSTSLVGSNGLSDLLLLTESNPRLEDEKVKSLNWTKGKRLLVKI